MVHANDRAPGNSAVTVLAKVSRLDVRNGLTRCCNAIVATRAIPEDRSMVKDRTGPRRRRVTILAIVARCNVRSRFPCCGDAVMATRAGAMY